MAPETAAKELQELMRGVVCRDRAAFAALYDRTAPQLFGIALRILRQREEAEDVLQEAFVAVWDPAASFDPERGSGMAWLVTLLRHRAIDRRRPRAHLEAPLRSEEDLLAPTAAAAGDVEGGVGAGRGGRPARCPGPAASGARSSKARSRGRARGRRPPAYWSPSRSGVASRGPPQPSRQHWCSTSRSGRAPRARL